MTGDEPLSGGYVNQVVRNGNTVRRAPGGSPFVSRLLSHLEVCGYAAAPRHLGRDAEGREVLSYLPGNTRFGAVSDDDTLHTVGGMLRRLHEATAGTPLAGPCDVVCHNDASPRNTIFGDAGPMAFIDWDGAAPGRAVDDLAWTGWQFLDLGPHASVEWIIDRMRALLDGYGARAPAGLGERMAACQRRSRNRIAVQAALGAERFIAMRDAGALDALRRVIAFTSANAGAINRGLSRQ